MAALKERVHFFGPLCRKMWICQVDRIQGGISKINGEIATTKRKNLEEQLDNVRLNTSINGPNLS
jgi:hypothetical protein